MALTSAFLSPQNAVMPPKRRATRNSQRTTTPPTETTEQMVQRRISEAIAQYEASRNRNDGSNNGRETAENPIPPQQGCSYKSFLACKPSTFNGTEGAIGIIHWIEKMEGVIDISECAPNRMVKYATCTLTEKALTWWNAQLQTLGRTAAYALSWEDLKRMILEEFCPRSELQKIETELWNIQMTGADVKGYTTRFQELARLVPHMVTPEYKRIERYNWGLAPQIRSLVMSSNPTTFRSAVELAQSLTDDAVRMKTLNEKPVSVKTEPNSAGTSVVGGEKRKWNNEGSDRQGQLNKGNAGNNRAYAITTTEARPYLGKRPKCGNCGLHHEGNCSRCVNCNRWGHLAEACKSNPIKTGCFECGDTGHYRNRCPKLNRNNNNNNNNNRIANSPPARGRA